jgi:hypothetical protein
MKIFDKPKLKPLDPSLEILEKIQEGEKDKNEK